MKIPRRHGVVVRSGNRCQLILGIWQVFDPWVNPQLQYLQDHTFPGITRPLAIEYHFRRVVHRLIRSLLSLYQHIRGWDRFLEAGGLTSKDPQLVFEIPEEAGIAADSVFHYLTLFIDDIARIIPYILEEEGKQYREPDGFSEMKRLIVNEKIPVPQTFFSLFQNLDREDSWYNLGFKRGIGMRQRLTHYTDLVIFRGRTKEGENQMSGDVSLGTIGGPIRVVDFEEGLKTQFRNLCVWLDRVDYELLTFLSKRLVRKGISWNPFDETVPSIDLPVMVEIDIEESNYYYFPVCR